MANLITLTTDFGLRDGYGAVMKGVILGIAPQATLIDITHDIAPQNVRQAANILARDVAYFPANTIHVCVVDPGVGTARRPLAVRFGSQVFVGPDNGLITLLHARAQQEGWPMEFYHLDQPQYWLAEISNVFHGRDLFAPVAAHLANGVRIDSVGSRIHDPVLLPLSAVERTTGGLRGEVTHIDHFGNLATSILKTDLSGLGNVSVRIRGVEIGGVARTFGDRAAGELVALIDSAGELAVAVVNGDAAKRLGAKVGDRVEIVSSSS
ncbi:MAG: SAM-dependent chlorinase/fluorinase [Chloroflexi bacterium]|nr:SAM-dependent chlorinase/fluorinase [Chloroflexota bacterium]